jgi:hypothetical protein
MKKLILKIINMILFVTLLLLVILIVMIVVHDLINILGFRSGLLSKSEQKYMIEQAKQGNVTAMGTLRNHYFADRNIILGDFYDYKMGKAQYQFTENELKKLIELAKQGNEDARSKANAYQWTINEEQRVYEQLDNNLSLMQNFLNDCSLDDFCKSSDIYKHYSQKAKNISWNKTSNAK